MLFSTRLLTGSIGLLFGLFLLPLGAGAQGGGGSSNRVDNTAPTQGPINGAATETQVDILSSYYQQNGDHGAVRGGIGTQHLTDVTPTIIVNIPLDTISRLTANVGADFYASASTDRIDYVLSTPSAQDVRVHADFNYLRQRPAQRQQVGYGGGVSKEYDYLSFNATSFWSQTSRDGSRDFSVAGQVYIDQAKLIYPIELRTGDQLLPTNKRQSYNLTLVLAQIINRKLQVALSTELVYQHGLLSTPFHRVYFRDAATPIDAGAPKVERLPMQRFKYPVSLRLSYYATDLVLLRGFYRFYHDNFGITAHTVEVEAPVKLTPFFVLYPFYRYHHQTAARYFAPYAAHSVLDDYYTSDYDLAGFAAQKYGLGARYSPVYGLGRFKTPFHDHAGNRRVALFKALDLRYAHYRQTTGLTANIVSADLSFTMR